MSRYRSFEEPLELDWEGLIANIRRAGTPRRVHHIELYQDAEIQEAIAERYGLAQGLDAGDPWFAHRKYVEVQRFCGFDYARVPLVDVEMPLHKQAIDDTADLRRGGGREYQDEHTGPIMSWEDFERYPWPDPRAVSTTRELEWYQENLPDDMCIIASGGFAHFAELLTWLMGYETLCYSLFDQRDLVQAIAGRLTEIYRVGLERILEFDRVRAVWGSDDMGYRTGPLISPADLRELVLPGHQLMARMSHEAGRPYLLHCCGNIELIMEDLIEDVKIDARHSFEDTIEDVRDLKAGQGQRIALLGGIDVDFLCRADEEAIRTRVRDTLEICQPGGGYCLGTGNSVANYIPLDSYLAMLDEGRLWARR